MLNPVSNSTDAGGSPCRPPVAEAPTSEEELLTRSRGLAGLSLSELAQSLGVGVPPDLRRAKGWVGVLMEAALGATAQSRAEPDFESLGIELKTLPLTRSGGPLESTFVCTIPLTEVGEVEWQSCRVRKKLGRVLWVPVQGERSIPVAERRIGAGFLWSPNEEQEAALRFDWEELAGYIGRGDVESITGHLGQYLQVRPKAANSRSRRKGVDEDGATFEALPRGFYLRTQFTQLVLKQSGLVAR